jgi:hypothetical protein
MTNRYLHLQCLVCTMLMSRFWQSDLACGPPRALEDFRFEDWVPIGIGAQLRKWLGKVIKTTREALYVGQIGVLVGSAGLPLQEQHRDDPNHHVVFLMRCTHPAQT